MVRTIDELLAGLGSDGDIGGKPVQYPAGTRLIEQGASDDTVYLLLSGALHVVRRVGDLEVDLGQMSEPGSVVGEITGMGGGIRSASVVAESDCELVAFDSSEFQELLDRHHHLAERLAELAVRRAEQGELADLLSVHFALTDPAVLAEAMESMEWIYLPEGQTLFHQGDPSDAVYFVIRGRLAADRQDRDSGMGGAGRGEVVGETGLLLGEPRTATLVALRDSVLARLDEEGFLRLVERHPRFMLRLAGNLAGRVEAGMEESSPTPVLVLAFSPSVDPKTVVQGMVAELERIGPVAHLSRGKVDAILGSPGLAEAEAGNVAELPVARLLHEAEVENRHLILETGQLPSNWSRRCLQIADRLVLVVARDDPTIGQFQSLMEQCPPALARTLLIVHPEGAGAPSGSARPAELLDVDDVLHVVSGSRSDLARVARVTTGRGNTLVLGGGGARGLAHVGVARALSELGIDVDIVGGTSIGGILATVIADGMGPNEMMEWAKVHFDRPFDYTLPVVSLIKGARIARSAEITFGQRTIEDLRRSYFAVSTNLTTAQAHVHRRGSIGLAGRATSAIPGVMPPVPQGEHLLIDGGVLNNLPIDVARRLAPAGQVMAIDVAPAGGGRARADFGLAVSGWRALRSRTDTGRRTYPALTAVLMRSMFTASTHERDLQVEAGLADLHVYLEMRNVSFLDFSDPEAIARQGYEAVMPRLEAWLETSPAGSRG